MDRAQGGCSRGFHRRIGGLLGERVDEALRVLVPSRFQRRDGRETVLRRSVFAGGEDRSLGEFQSRDDARVAFLGELGLERRQRLFVVGREHVPGRLEALLGIGARQGERAHCALDGASKRVVDSHLLEGGGVRIGNGFASLGVDERACGSLVGDDVIGGINEQAVVAERVQNGRGLRRRLGGQLDDRGRGLGELVGEELRQRVVDGVGAGGARRHQRHGKTKRAESASCVPKGA